MGRTISFLKNMEVLTVAQVFVNEFVSRYGLGRQILRDQGRQFESVPFKEICELLDIDKKKRHQFPSSDQWYSRKV